MKSFGSVRVCSDCKLEKPNNRENFGSRGKRWKHLASHCKECHNKRSRERHHRYKIEALRHYSGGVPSCSCCGELHVEFLSFDHVEGGGSHHRRTVKSTTDMAYWLRKQGYPPGYRVMCMNCNTSLGFHGYCPHSRSITTV